MHLHLYDNVTPVPEKSAEKFKRDFQTPHEVCRYMVDLLPVGVKKVLEPTPGDGNIVKAAEAKGLIVTAPIDYFQLPVDRYDAVIMNPPFSSKFTFLENAPETVTHTGMRIGYWFLQECMKRSDIVIALMPWFTISDSDLRLRFLMDYGLKSITALPRKTFQYARIQTCIFELNKGFKGDTVFRSGRELLYPDEKNNMFFRS
jgi:type I restriction-modification system DNA methylase subunit